MALKGSTFTVLHVGDSHLSYVRFRVAPGGLHVAGSAMQSDVWSDEESAQQAAIKAFAKEHGLGEDTLYTVLPRHDVTARILELPSQDAEEIAGMVQLSAEELVPYPANELIIDEEVLDRLENGSSRVFVAVAHQDVVNRHLDLLTAAGLKPDQIFLSTACLMAAAAATPSSESDCYALVNLAAGGIEVLVVRDGKTEYSRGIPAQQDWTLKGDGRTDALEELRIEVRSSITAHRRESEDGTGADQMYLCSEWAPLDEPAQFLAEELGYPCAPAAFALKPIQEGADTLQSVPLVSVGAALTVVGRARVSVNLLPKKVQKQRLTASARMKAIRAGVAVAVVCALLGGAYFQVAAQRQAYIETLEERVAMVRPHVRDLNTKRKHLERLQSQVERKESALELLNGVVEQMPQQGMNITRFQFRHDESITLNGRAKTQRAIEQLSENLRQAAEEGLPQFANALEQYRNQRSERNEMVWDFEIAIPFPSAEEEGDE